MKKYLFKAVAALFIISAIPSLSQAQIRMNLGKDSPMRKMQIAEMAITNLYVDSVNEQQLVEDGIRGMLEKLDPHSSYTTAKETKAMNEPLQGSFDGIGVQFNMVEDTLLIIQPVSGGPSEKAGIMAGDRIVTVNDTLIAGVKMNRDEIMRRLRGKRGTRVKLGIERRGIGERLTFTVTRDKIPVNTLDAAYMIKPGVGYIRIGSFGATTYDEFMTSVDSLRQKGMRDLILDLEENGGGYLQAAVMIANEFLDKGDLIVYTEGRRTNRDEYKARGNGHLTDGRVIVLVNEYTASAAEIVSGAIQDQDRGIIVGRRTFGKGLVQRPIEFDDGSMMRLTVAHYYTPSGRCIQKPYRKGEKEDYALDIEKRFKHGELYSADSIRFDDSQKYLTLRKQRTVYGGGGIMPDHFVPLDTTQFTSFHRKISAKSIIVNNNLKYIDANRRTLQKKYKSFEQFDSEYEVPKKIIEDILADADKQDIHPAGDKELYKTLPLLKLQIKALIARDLWDMNAYFHVINRSNDIVNKALELLSQ